MAIEHLPQAIKAVNVFSAKKDIRYYFNGVALYVLGGKIIGVAATDGVSMAVVGEVPNDPSDYVIIDNKDVAVLINATATDNGAVVSDGTLSIGMYKIPRVDGRYPDIRRVIPKEIRVAGNEIGIQPDFLAKLKPFKAALCQHLSAREKNIVGCKMHCGDANSAVRFDFDNGLIDTAMVIINQMRL